MTRAEAIKILQADLSIWNDHIFDIKDNALESAVKVAIEALEQEPTIAQERYQDLCDYFGNDTEIIENFLNDGEEFKKWLERVRFNTKGCNELHDELETIKRQELTQSQHIESVENKPDALESALETEDCISRKALLSHLYNFKTQGEGIVQSTILAIENCVEDMPSVQPKHGEWIPTSKRQPEQDGFYIATLDGEICGEDKPFAGLAEFENGKWVNDEEDYQCVLAWMSPPEPYKQI